MVIKEGIVHYKIQPNEELTLPKIEQALKAAFSNKYYAKFSTDKYFIQVNFNTDGSIAVSSNIICGQFLQDLVKMNKFGWNYTRVKTFIYNWMQLHRASLY